MSATITRQPKYNESPHKFMAREFNRRLHRLYTGKDGVSKNRQYLTLANIQDKSPKSEINQLVNSGLIIPSQFVGIDYNKHYINRNKKNHPLATWIHGDWNLILENPDISLNPELVYLDSTHFGDKLPALKTLKTTLNICQEGTLVICNVMETNPRSGLGETVLDSKVLIEKLIDGETSSKYRQWNTHKKNLTLKEAELSNILIPSYRYKTSKTLMRSYIFYKGQSISDSTLQKEFKDFDLWCENFEREFCNGQSFVSKK